VTAHATPCKPMSAHASQCQPTSNFVLAQFSKIL
jgi:hypothetical protein